MKLTQRGLFRLLLATLTTAGVSQARAAIQPTPGGGEQNQPSPNRPVRVQPDRNSTGNAGDTRGLPPTGGNDASVSPILGAPTRTERPRETIRPRTGRTHRGRGTQNSEPSRLGHGVRAGDERSEDQTVRSGRAGNVSTDDSRQPIGRAGDSRVNPGVNSNAGSAPKTSADASPSVSPDASQGQVSLQRRLNELKPTIAQRRVEIRRVRSENKEVFGREFADFRDGRTHWLANSRLSVPRQGLVAGSMDQWSDSYARLIAEDPILDNEGATTSARWLKPMPVVTVYSYPETLTVAENIEALSRDAFDSVAQAGSIDEAAPMRQTLGVLVGSAIAYTDSVQKHDEWTDSLGELFALDQALMDTEMRLKDSSFGRGKVGAEVDLLRSAVNRLLLTYKRVL